MDVESQAAVLVCPRLDRQSERVRKSVIYYRVEYFRGSCVSYMRISEWQMPGRDVTNSNCLETCFCLAFLNLKVTALGILGYVNGQARSAHSDLFFEEEATSC